MQEFIDTASEEGQSLLELGGVMTLQATSRAKKAAGMAVTAPQVAGKMLSENILGYYRDTLSDIHEHGYAKVASDVIDPYGNAIVKQFSKSTETWTEKIFTGSVSGLQRIFGMQTSKQQLRKEVELDLAGELDVPCNPQSPLEGVTAGGGAPSGLSNPHYN